MKAAVQITKMTRLLTKVRTNRARISASLGCIRKHGQTIPSGGRSPLSAKNEASRNLPRVALLPFSGVYYVNGRWNWGIFLQQAPFRHYHLSWLAVERLPGHRWRYPITRVDYRVSCRLFVRYSAHRPYPFSFRHQRCLCVELLFVTFRSSCQFFARYLVIPGTLLPENSGVYGSEVRLDPNVPVLCLLHDCVWGCFAAARVCTNECLRHHSSHCRGWTKRRAGDGPGTPPRNLPPRCCCLTPTRVIVPPMTSEMMNTVLKTQPSLSTIGTGRHGWPQAGQTAGLLPLARGILHRDYARVCVLINAFIMLVVNTVEHKQSSLRLILGANNVRNLTGVLSFRPCLAPAAMAGDCLKIAVIAIIIGIVWGPAWPSTACRASSRSCTVCDRDYVNGVPFHPAGDGAAVFT